MQPSSAAKPDFPSSLTVLGVLHFLADAAATLRKSCDCTLLCSLLCFHLPNLKRFYSSFLNSSDFLSSSQKNTKLCCFSFCTKAICEGHKPISQGWLPHLTVTKANLLCLIWPYSTALLHWAVKSPEGSRQDVLWGEKRTNILLVEAAILTCPGCDRGLCCTEDLCTCTGKQEQRIAWAENTEIEDQKCHRHGVRNGHRDDLHPMDMGQISPQWHRKMGTLWFQPTANDWP